VHPVNFRGPAPVSPDFQPLVFTPPLIRKALFGFPSDNWPRTTATPPAHVASIGSVTNFADRLMMWSNFHTATNTINWAVLDTYVANARAAGVTEGKYQVYGTPAFLASTGAGTLGPYGLLGECAYPGNGDASLAQTTYFCTQFAQRNISAWGRFFTLISAGNEMDWRQTTGPLVFWWGTRAQYVDFAWAVRAAFEAADPAMRIGSAGTFKLYATDNGLDQIMNQSGTVFPTKTGKDVFEIFCGHPYGAGPSPAQPNQSGDFLSNSSGGIREASAFLNLYGKTMQGYVADEWGVSNSNDVGTVLAQFLAQSATFRSNFIERMFMMAPMQGCQGIYPWYHSSSGAGSLSGNWVTDTTGVINGYIQASTNLVGKTAVAGGYFKDGRVSLTFSDGTSRTV